jgi:hypothetical protein
MATPTVRHDNQAAAAGSGLVSVLMPRLQTLLLAAGWTIEHADADAIGTGTAAAPAWDKTPAANTDAGIAVYKMPLNGHTTQWFARVRPGWAGATTRVHMRGLTIGAAHDGSGSVTGGGAELVPAVVTGNTDALEWQAAVSEDGFVVILGTISSHPLWAVERARLLAGAVTDDVIAYNKGTSTTTGYAGRLASASAGEVNSSYPVALVGHHFGGTAATIPSVESQDAAEIVVLGPYHPGGLPLFAPPRLWLLASPADVPGNADRVLTVDGAARTYRAMSASISTSLGIILVATG